MAITVILPKLGLTMKKGKIVDWLKQEEDSVNQGEYLLEIVTEKTNVKIESPGSGVVYRILAGKGMQVPVNAPVAVLAEAGDDEELLQKTAAGAQAALDEALAGIPGAGRQSKEFPPAAPSAASARKLSVSPRAARLAEKEGVDLGLVEGTGPGGRIVEKDIVTYLEDLARDRETETIPMEGMRRVIAERMSESSRNAARVTVLQEVDVTVLQHLRRRINDSTGSEGVKISFTDMLIRIVAKALREHKTMNARVYGDRIELVNAVNIGVAVDIEGGLVVPVLHNAHRLSLENISWRVRDLAGRARTADLEPEELQGGTFTLSNLGMFGAEGFTPIINPPETAILGVGRIVEKPALAGDNLLRKSMVTLSLSFDHRAVDGGPAARFLERIKKLVEDPYQLFGLPGKKGSTPYRAVGGHHTPNQIYSRFKKGMSGLMDSAPDMVMGFSALTEGVFFDDGELSQLNKELIAVAVSVYMKCEYCITAHIYKALEAGATPAQVLEAAGVAVFFGGGAAMAYTATLVQECIEAFT